MARFNIGVNFNAAAGAETKPAAPTRVPKS
jgi:hypothetical protein